MEDDFCAICLEDTSNCDVRTYHVITHFIQDVSQNGPINQLSPTETSLVRAVDNRSLIHLNVIEVLN